MKVPAKPAAYVFVGERRKEGDPASVPATNEGEAEVGNL